MKYFTSEWWSSGCEDESIVENYQKYYLSISSKLPNMLRSLEEEHTLHDANVKYIKSDLVNSVVIMSLRGWDISLNHQVIYELIFQGVAEFTQVFPQEGFVESELGDLGYWEYEVNDNITMKMLFSSGCQFTVVFDDFEFSNTPVKAQRAAK